MQTVCCARACMCVCRCPLFCGTHCCAINIRFQRGTNKKHKLPLKPRVSRAHRVETGHAESRGSVFDIEEEEDVNKSHDAVEGTPAPGTRADVRLL